MIISVCSLWEKLVHMSVCLYKYKVVCSIDTQAFFLIKKKFLLRLTLLEFPSPSFMLFFWYLFNFSTIFLSLPIHAQSSAL